MEDFSKFYENIVSLIQLARNLNCHSRIVLLQDVDPEDEKALAKFMNPNPQPRITLADIIMGKITEKQTEIQDQPFEEHRSRGSG